MPCPSDPQHTSGPTAECCARLQSGDIPCQGLCLFHSQIWACFFASEQLGKESQRQLLRADKSPGSSSAARVEPQGSRRNTRDGMGTLAGNAGWECWLGMLAGSSSGLALGTVSGRAGPGGTHCVKQLSKEKVRRAKSSPGVKTGSRAGGAGGAPAPAPSHLTWQTLQAQPRADLTFPCSFYSWSWEVG